MGKTSIIHLIGFSIFVGVAVCQEKVFLQESFPLNIADMETMQNFESLKIGNVDIAEEKSSITSESVQPADFEINFGRKNATQTRTKKELARLMRQQFEKFKKSLIETAKNPNTNKEKRSEIQLSRPGPSTRVGINEPKGFQAIIADSSGTVDDLSVASNVVIGEVVTKSERRAGEEPSGVRSGFLRIDSHPIPVTFTSLPGFPSIGQPATGIPIQTSTQRVGTFPSRIPGRRRPATGTIPTVSSGGRFPNVAIDRTFGGGQRGSAIRGAGFDRVQSVPGTSLPPAFRGPGRPPTRNRRPNVRSGSSRPQGGISNGIGHLMRILESRLIGGIRSDPEANGRTGTRVGTGQGTSPLQEFDPSIVINFLTLVALTQEQRRGGFVIGSGSNRGSQSQRNASPVSTSVVDGSGAGSLRSDSNFGPFSDGKDPSAGVDPSTIGLPPVLRQTLYSYLLPRLSSLTSLVETLPGVPGLDYPIISTVPYTNFYCSNMPWPGFYADTEARCQLWHYCDLEGRQASFLCPNGTIFNQAFFVCDWWYNFDCPSAPYLYSMNERVFAVPEVEETEPHRPLTAEILDTIFL